MTTDARLATREQQGGGMALAATPKEYAQAVVQAYADWATIIMEVVEKRHLFTEIQGKRFLQFEAWQLIASFDRASLDTSDVKPIERDGSIVGYMCHAKVIKDGVVQAGGTQGCWLTATVCRGKQGEDRDRAAISAAQTWAASKAARMKYSAVAVMAGYEAATAEEMRPTVEADELQHWCEQHQLNWFMRGRMTGYGHPVEGQRDWCHESASQPGQRATAEHPPILISRNGPARAPTAPAETAEGSDGPDASPFDEPTPTHAVASPLPIAGHVRSVTDAPTNKRPPMPNAGAFLNYAFTTHRLTRTKALDAVGVTDTGQINNWEEAAALLDEAMAQRKAP